MYYPYIPTSKLRSEPMAKKIFLPSSEEGWVLFIGIWGMADSSVRSIAVAIGREGTEEKDPLSREIDLSFRTKKPADSKPPPFTLSEL